ADRVTPGRSASPRSCPATSRPGDCAPGPATCSSRTAPTATSRCTSDEIPAERGPAAHVLAEGAPEDDVEAARLEPAGRSDRADVRLGDLVAGADVLDHELGAAQPLALRLAPRRADIVLAQPEAWSV